MTTIPFTTDVLDPNSPVTFGYDIDFVLEVEATMDGSEPSIEVKEVWLDGMELLTAKSPICNAIGHSIVVKAEASDWIAEMALEDAGLGWRARGANDPDGQYAEAMKRFARRVSA